jgi:hypothetical protein
MATAQDNEQRLRDAGVIVIDELPREYRAVVEGLTPDELEVIVAMKTRLNEAHRVSGTEIVDVMIAP